MEREYLNFHEAVKALHECKIVTRIEWKDKHRWFLIMRPLMPLHYQYMNSKDPSEQVLIVKFEPYIAKNEGFRIMDGTWDPKVEDMLAEDWYVL